MRKLSASQKIRIIKEVLEKSRPLCLVAKEFGIARQTLYLWIREFKKNPHKAQKVLKNHYQSGRKHHKRLPYSLEKKILDLVVKYPDLSLRKLARRLADAKIKVSSHGVYNVLVRNSLQTRELRLRFAQLHPVKTVRAAEISAANRLKVIEQHLREGLPIAKVSKIWGVSRPTFYEWLRRYREALPTPGVSVAEALARRYKRGYENHRSISEKVREVILELVRGNPVLSVHKIYEQVPRIAGKAVVGHHGIQNILSRENLSTFAKRLIFAGGFAPEPSVAVAPLYRPQIPVYRLRMILAPFASIPKLMITNPRAGISRLSFALVALFIIGVWFRMVVTSQTSAVGLVFASIALFFGLFFFIYSLKYYISILVILRLAQSGMGQSDPSMKLRVNSGIEGQR